MAVEFERRGGRFPNFAAIKQEALLAEADGWMDDYLARATGRVARGVQPYTAPGAKTQQSRSGRSLKRLKDYTVERTAEDVEGTIYLTQGFALSEFGGTIRARNGKYLAIPLPDALNPNGTPKKAGPRSWSGTRVIKSRRGNLLIVQQRRGKMIPLYVLKPMVKVPMRLGLRKALRTERAGLRKDVATGIKRLLASKH